MTGALPGCKAQRQVFSWRGSSNLSRPVSDCWNCLRNKTWKLMVSLKKFKIKTNELPHEKTNKMACAPNEDSDQPGHSPSLNRVFAVHMKKAWVLSNPLSAQQGLRSDWAGAQTDLSLRWGHSHFVGFVMRWLKSNSKMSTDSCLNGA